MTQQHKVTGVILAGGQGQRMGGTDKSQLRIGSDTLLARVVRSLGQQTDRVVVNSNNKEMNSVAGCVAIVADQVAGFAGPLAGVDAALRWNGTQPEPHRYVLSVATDTPFFPLDLAKKMCAAVAGSDSIAIAQSQGINQPVFGLWPQSLHDDLKDWLQDDRNRKVMGWVRRHAHAFVDFPPYTKRGQTVDPFFNINTPADLAVANNMIKAGI